MEIDYNEDLGLQKTEKTNEAGQVITQLNNFPNGYYTIQSVFDGDDGYSETSVKDFKFRLVNGYYTRFIITLYDLENNIINRYCNAYNIEDGIDEVLINIKILNVTQMKSEVVELLDILILCCDAVKEIFIAFNGLKNADLIKQKTIHVNHLEEQGDRVFEKLMSELYRNELNPIELIKWTNIFNCLENTIDASEEVADSVDEVVMKNS